MLKDTDNTPGILLVSSEDPEGQDRCSSVVSRKRAECMNHRWTSPGSSIIKGWHLKEEAMIATGRLKVIQGLASFTWFLTSFYGFFLLFLFLACMRDLSSPTRDRTHAPCSGSVES